MLLEQIFYHILLDILPIETEVNTHLIVIELKDNYWTLLKFKVLVAEVFI